MGRGVLSNPYKGIRGMRYQFMKDHMPDELRRMDEADETGDYLDDVERRYLARIGQLYPILLEECGATEELKRRDYGEFMRAMDRAEARTSEIAFHEVIEAL